MQLNFELQHFPVRQLPGPDRSEKMLDRIQLKQIAPTVNTSTMNENLGWTPNLDSFFYFIQKLLEVELLEVLFRGVHAAPCSLPGIPTFSY